MTVHKSELLAVKWLAHLRFYKQIVKVIWRSRTYDSRSLQRFYGNTDLCVNVSKCYN